MRTAIPFLVLALALCCSPALAKPRATVVMMCSDANKVKLPSVKLKKIETTIACAFAVKGYRGEAQQLVASIFTVWGKPGDLKNSEGKSSSSVVAEGDALLLVPPALAPLKDFPPCESFTLEGQVADSEGPIFRKKLKIVQRCAGAAAPKKLKAKLSCVYESEDGTLYRFPGNGAKAKPRMERELACTISIPSVPAGQAVKGSLKGKGKARESDARQVPTNAWVVAAGLSSGEGDFESCMSFTVTGELTSGGQQVWKGTLPIKQSCPD